MFTIIDYNEIMDTFNCRGKYVIALFTLFEDSPST